MDVLVLFLLFILGLPLFLLIRALCSQETCIIGREEQQHRPEPQQPTTTLQQQARVQQSVDPNNFGPIRIESHSYRSYLGYVLKSNIDLHEIETHDEKKEKELSPESQSEADPVTVATDKLDKHGSSTTNKLKKTNLSVDFGDFEILPLEESSCPICLLDYEHGETVQRNASNGNINNFSSRYHQNNTTSTNQSIDMNQCDHIFHKNCITKWMQSNTNHECPICRRAFRDGDAPTHSHTEL